jgi:hypothetical protein
MLWEFSIWFSSFFILFRSFRENLFRSHSCFIRISFNLHFLSRLVWFSLSLTWIILFHSRSLARFLLRRFDSMNFTRTLNIVLEVYIDEFITCVDNLCFELGKILRIKNSQKKIYFYSTFPNLNFLYSFFFEFIQWKSKI